MNWYRTSQQTDVDEDMTAIMQGVAAAQIASGAAKRYSTGIRVSSPAIRRILGLFGLEMFSVGAGDRPRSIAFNAVSDAGWIQGQTATSIREALKHIPEVKEVSYRWVQSRKQTMVTFEISFPMKPIFVNMEAEDLDVPAKRMPPRKFVPGTKVRKNMGIKDKGTVVKPFPWHNSTDGTYKPPGKEEVPVLWDGGTKGWANKAWLEIIE